MSFSELKKLIIGFKDYDKVGEAFKNKISEVNKREPIYEEIKVNEKNKKFPKTPYNANQPQAQSQPKPNEAASTLSRSTGQKPLEQTLTCIVIERKKEDAEERELKESLRNSAKGGGSMIQGSKKPISSFESAEREIKFNLNLITLENFNSIKKELVRYVVGDEQECEKLIHTMIEKAWIEPKFAIIYAKLSSEFGKLDNFKWGEKREPEGKKKGSNPFKTVLIKVVQEVFEDDFTQKDRREKEKLEVIKEEPEGEAKQEKEVVEDKEEEFDIKTLKKKIIGNVRFIGELLLQKVLSKKIVFYCIGHLLECFFKHYALAADKNHSDLAEIYFESLVELIEKVGDKFESAEDKFTQEQFGSFLKKFEAASSTATTLPVISTEEWLITSERFFEIFDLIDKEVLMKKYPRISALLKNLTERKNDNWASHVVENRGPMTLNEVRREDDEQEDRARSKKDTFDYEKEWCKIFAKYDKGQYLKEDTIDEYVEYTDANVKDDLKRFFKQDTYEIVSAYVRIFADGPRPVVERRVKLFEILLLDLGFIKSDHLKQGWLKNAAKLCYSDFPLAAQYFPKVMALLNSKFPIHVPDWEVVNPDDDEETEYAADVINRYKKEIAK